MRGVSKQPRLFEFVDHRCQLIHEVVGVELDRARQPRADGLGYTANDEIRGRLDALVRLHPQNAARLLTLQRWSDAVALLITTDFLPQRFRDEMRIPWVRTAKTDSTS